MTETLQPHPNASALGMRAPVPETLLEKPQIGGPGLKRVAIDVIQDSQVV